MTGTSAEKNKTLGRERCVNIGILYINKLINFKTNKLDKLFVFCNAEGIVFICHNKYLLLKIMHNKW